MRRARSRGSAVAGCTGTGRSRAPSSVAACSPGASPAGRSPPSCGDGQAMPVTNRPRRIILIRHGESQGNIDDSIYETVPDHALTLTAKGREEATAAGSWLRAYLQDEPVTLYTSPYVRTRQTADLLGLGIESEAMRTEPRLREQDWANFQDPA